MDGKTIQCLPNASQHVPYLSLSNSFRVTRCLSQCVSPKSLFLPHFCFSRGRPWGNHAKCCTNGKRIRCLQIVSQHVPIYHQQFPSYSNRKCKKIAIFTYCRPHFCFPWGRPCNYRAMLHGWKDNLMLAKRLAACTYSLSSIVSELYDA